MILLGIVLGAAGALLAAFVLRHLAMAQIAGQISYRFHTCVFGEDVFPDGDFDNGRLIRRAFVPITVTTRFFDAGFHEVQKAERPGRYGAVVKIRFLGGPTTYRFITLYRTPDGLRGDMISLPGSMLVTGDFGIDSKVAATQSAVVVSEAQNEFMAPDTGASPERFAILLAGLSEMAPTDPPAHFHDGPAARNAAWWYELKTRLGLAPSYPYLVDLPQGYAAGAAKRWPLILFLHSADKGGTDLNKVRHCGLADVIAKGRQVPAIVVSPQRPESDNWSLPALAHLLDTIQQQYQVDPDHVYVTGVSDGGDKTWNLGLLYPERFAAIVPMSGESDTGDAARLKNLPIWGFNGGRDLIMPPVIMESMVNAVRHAGGHAHFTIIPDGAHDCWDQAYSTDALWAWLFAQKRGRPEARVDGTPTP